MTIRSSFILGATIAVAAMTVTSIACSGNEPEPERAYDVIIVGGRVVDGTGAPWFRADVGVMGDRIAAIGDLSEAPAESRIDAAGLVIAPGFIDMLGQSEFNVLVDSRAASKITQGITTEVTGEGASIAPVNDRMMEASKPSYAHYGVEQDFRTLEEYFSRLKESPPAINIATFIGSGGIRDFVIGREDRRASPEELDEMKQMVARAMEAGALGLSASLQYVPDRFNSTDELVAMASVAAEYGGIYITHQRSEGNLIFESLDEVFEIAERAAIPAEVWHLKTAYKANWGKMGEVLERFEVARARGLDVTANQYPYIRASNGLDACLPVWVREGSTEEMLSRLKDASLRERIKTDMAADDVTEWENQWYGSGGAEGVMLSSVLDPELRKYEGKTMAQIGAEMGKDPRDALMDLVIADGGESSCIISIMNEEDVRTALKHPLVSVDTDSSARAEDGPFSETKSHPRAWGTFPRILGKYVREEALLTLEEAVRKMTSRPAARVKLMDRGILRAGMAADITVFDPATISDVATFEDPTHYSVGVRYVFVNGRAVVSEGEITDERPGRVLRGPGYRTP